MSNDDTTNDPGPTGDPISAPLGPAPPNGFLVFSAIVCFLVAALVVVAATLYVRKKHKAAFKIRIKTLFYCSTFISAILSMIWCIAYITHHTDMRFIVGTFAQLFFTTAFALIVMYWANHYNKQLDPEKRADALLMKLRWAMLGVQILLWIWVILIMILYLTQADGTNNSWQLNALIWTLVAFQVLLAAGFLLYGALFTFSTAKLLSGREDFWKLTLRITFTTGLFLAAFSLMAIMMTWHRMTGEYMNSIVYIFFAYLFPRVFVTIAQLYLMREKDAQGYSQKKRLSNQTTLGAELLKHASQVDPKPEQLEMTTLPETSDPKASLVAHPDKP